jgi:hypothetical protein
MAGGGLSVREGAGTPAAFTYYTYILYISYLLYNLVLQRQREPLNTGLTAEPLKRS